MTSTKRSLINRMLAGAATATVALGLLGAAPAMAADHDQDNWWYNNNHQWHGNNNHGNNNNWHDHDNGHGNNNNWNYSSGYRYYGGRPYYYAPPPAYYYTPPPAYYYPPAYAGPPTLNFGFSF